MPLWELQIDSTGGSGWKGWRIELSTDKRETIFAYDERDEIETAEDAVLCAMQTEAAAEFIEDGDFKVKVVEIRTVISAEVNPN